MQWRTRCALLMVDLDRFKTINDRYGHQTGDRVIQSISSLLKEVFGEAHRYLLVAATDAPAGRTMLVPKIELF